MPINEETLETVMAKCHMKSLSSEVRMAFACPVDPFLVDCNHHKDDQPEVGEEIVQHHPAYGNPLQTYWWVLLLLIVGVAGGIGISCVSGQCIFSQRMDNREGNLCSACFNETAEHSADGSQLPPTPSATEKCSSIEKYPGFSLKGWYLDHTNGGSGKAFQCEELCLKDPRCNSWMWRNSGNTCYLSESAELVERSRESARDHHPHTMNQHCCRDLSGKDCLTPPSIPIERPSVDELREDLCPHIPLASPSSHSLLVMDNVIAGTDTGTYFRIEESDLTAIIGNDRWTDQREVLPLGVPPVGIKQNEGSVFRVRNSRTERIGGVLIWLLGNETVIGSWNPSEYAKPMDWRIEDRIEFLDFGDDRPVDPILPVWQYTELTSTGWSLPGQAIQFGQSGLAGDYWKELEIQYDLSLPSLVTGIWTDSFTLPYSVFYEDGEEWELAGVFVGSTSVLPSFSASKIRLRWNSTDLFLLNGLSTYRSGGGLHAEPTGIVQC